MENHVHMFDNDETGFMEYATTTLDQLKNMNGVVNICWAYIVYALGYQSAKSSIIESNFVTSELGRYVSFCADIRSKLGMNTDALLVFCFPEGPASEKYYASRRLLRMIIAYTSWGCTVIQAWNQTASRQYLCFVLRKAGHMMSVGKSKPLI